MRACAFAVLLAALLSVKPAWAHRFAHPKLLRLGIAKEQIVLSLTFDVNPGEESRFLRRLFDKDSNGKLDEAEQAALLRYLEETATLFLKLRIGGKAVPLVAAERNGSRLGLPRESSDTLGVALLFRAAIPASPELLELEVEDRMADAKTDVPLVVDLDPAAVVAFASQGELHPREHQLQRVRLAQDWPFVLRVRTR
jgi:hypothetical protein